MTFPKSRILTTQQLIQQIIESNHNGERFCFILGSGASVESDIPSGNDLEMRWMDCIMGVADDLDTPAKDSDVTHKLGTNMYNEKLIEHNFDEIKAAWKEAKKKGKAISSAYYFDIYKLRFFPNRRNGYRYLEKVMEAREPSLGYHTLALLLTKTNQNNLVITTNFDSLVEDALFLYTNKKPLVVSHESLASYIESDIQRPIIAKVHRGLMYAPFNSPETTNELKGEWREALNYIFNTYTPIVIGYGGGDHSLMSFLQEETTSMRHGIYWCYLESSGLPEIGIQKFIKNKDGYFVTINGFDSLMMEIGKAMFKDEIAPSGTNTNLKNQYDARVEKYKTQWDKLTQKPELKQVIQAMNEAELQQEENRAKNKELTAWDYTRRGDRAFNKVDYQGTINAYTEAIKLRDNFASDYNKRGRAYFRLNEYEKAIEDYNKAIEVDPNFAAAYNNRGVTYKHLKEYEKAIENYNKSIEINPHYEIAYNNRGCAYIDIKEYEKAISDFEKAIQIKPDYAEAYNNRGFTYNNISEYAKAISDFEKAIQIKPDYAEAYNNRGCAYIDINKYEKAISDFEKAIQIKPDYAEAYNNRGFTYNNISEYAKAISDFEKAIQIKPDYPEAYNNRGCAYIDINEYEKAISDFEKAIQIKPDYADAYSNRAFAYNNISEYAKALQDYTKSIELNPENAEDYNNRGLTYSNASEYAKAILDFEKAIQIDPTSPHPYRHLGNTYCALEKYTEAITQFSKAIELNSKYKEAYLDRAKAYRKIGKENIAKADEEFAAQL